MVSKESGEQGNSTNRHSRQPNWALVIIPPLLISGLVFIPFDIMTMIFWGPAFIAAIISFCRLTCALLNIAREKSGFNRKNIRQIMTVATCMISFYVVGLSVDSAENFAIRTALEVQGSCDSTGVCPETIPGFDCGERGSCQTRYGEYGSKYFIFFSSEAAGQSFMIRHRISIDNWTTITGGLGRDLVLKRMMDDQVVDQKTLN